MAQVKILQNATDSLRILVLGEAGSGKSSFIKKFMDPSAKLEPLTDDNYWNYQEESHLTHYTTPSGQKVIFCEIPGSRGRMSNYMSLYSVLGHVDVIVNCHSLNPIYTSYLDGTMISSRQRIISMKSSFDQNNKKASKTSNGDCISFEVGTFADLTTDKEVDISTFAKLYGSQNFYQVSSATNKGVQEAMTDIINKSLAHVPAVPQVVVKKASNAKLFMTKLFKLLSKTGSSDSKLTETSVIAVEITAFAQSA